MNSTISCANAPRQAPHLIAIAGPSCAGKTTLAQSLARALPGAVHFPLDAYYTDLSTLPLSLRAGHNFDHPDALDFNLLSTHVRALANGLPVNAPVYDFRTHARLLTSRPITPSQYLVIEGLFALYFPALRPLYSYSLYIDVDPSISLKRRIQRDSAQHNRSEKDICRQFTQQVDPMAQRYIIPTRDHADCIVKGTDSPAALCAQIQQACVNLW